MNQAQPKPPIFVVGVPRSGTTLLAAMLSAHPGMVCGPETHFFSMLLPGVAARLCRRDGWPRAALDYLYSIRHVGGAIPSNYGLNREELAEELARKQPSTRSILAGMIELYMARHGKRRWIEKTPDHLPYVDRIRRYFPDSPIIRIVRDPRAVATSLLRVDWGPRNLIEALALWRNYDDRSAHFFERDARSHTLRYEGLVHNPEPALRDICRAIDEPFDPVMLDTNRSARLVNATAEAWKAKVSEGVDPSRAEAWSSEYSKDELSLAEACLGDRLRAYSYPVFGFDAPHPVEVHDLLSLARDPELITALVAQGARFWSLPGERPELVVLHGEPNDWLLGNLPARLRLVAQMGMTIARHRLVGVPVEWVNPTGRANIHGISAWLLSLVLPRPTASLRGLDLARSGGRTGRGGATDDGAAPHRANPEISGQPATHGDGR